MGFSGNTEGGFIARRRHLEALDLAETHLLQGRGQLLDARAGELLAAEIRLAQQALSEITVEFTAYVLMGRIFPSVCIRKSIRHRPRTSGSLS